MKPPSTAERAPSGASAKDEMKAGKDVGAVIQAVQILRVLADANAPLGVTAVARASGLNPSTTLNILRTLIGQGLVGFSAVTKSYWLDIGLLELSRSLLNRSHMELLLPELKRLTREFEAASTVWQIHGDIQLLIGRVVPEVGVHIEFPIASRVSAFAGASGRIRVALSNLPLEDIKRGFTKIQWNKPMSFERYMKEVRLAARNGYAVDVGDFLRGVTNVASIICDREGRPHLIVSMQTFVGQLSGQSIQALGQQIRALCQRYQGVIFGKAD